MNVLAPDWKGSKRLHITAGVHSAALTGYQYPVMVVIGSGVSGSYTHQTGITGSLMYVAKGECRDDFLDFRFYSGSTKYDFHRIAVTSGVQAEFNVEVQSDLTSDGTLDVIYGNFGSSGAVDASSEADTYVDVVSGVVGGWKMEEADTEQNPSIIYDNTLATTTYKAYQSGSGSYGVIVSDETTIVPQGSMHSCKVVIGSGAYSGVGATWNSGTIPNLSGKSLIRVKIYGDNSGFVIRLRIDDNAGHYAYWNITLNFSGWQQIILNLSSPNGSSGTLDLTNVINVWFYQFPSTTCTFYFDRLVFDVGVSALDSSGYGNTGTATGTTIVASPFYAGKNARQGSNGSTITVTNNSVLNPPNITLGYSLKTTVLDAATNQYLARKGTAAAGQRQYELYFGTNNKFYASIRKGDDSAWLTITGTTVATLNGIYRVRLTYDGTTLKLWVNGNLDASSNYTGAILVPVSGDALCIGHSYNGTYCLGILGEVFVCNAAFSSSQIANENNAYPDVGLIPGKVLVRKYAATTNPTHGSWEPEHTYYPPPQHSLTARIKRQPYPKGLNRKQTEAVLEYIKAKLEVENS